MKKFTLLFTFLALSPALFFSCEKEEIQPPTAHAALRSCPQCLSGIRAGAPEIKIGYSVSNRRAVIYNECSETIEVFELFLCCFSDFEAVPSTETEVKSTGVEYNTDWGYLTVDSTDVIQLPEIGEVIILFRNW